MTGAALVDTNILVYRFDQRFPDKQRRATAALRRGLNDDILRVPHQAIVVRLALRGAATYRLSWFDAHLWAYAEHFGMAELWSEDFQHDRIYGTVRAINPLLDSQS